MNLFCIFKSSLTASDSKWCDSNVLIHHNPFVNHLTNNTAKHAASSNHLHFFPSMLPRHTHFSHLTRILALNFLKFSIHPSISPSSPRIKRHWSSHLISSMASSTAKTNRRVYGTGPSRSWPSEPAFSGRSGGIANKRQMGTTGESFAFLWNKGILWIIKRTYRVKEKNSKQQN